VHCAEAQADAAAAARRAADGASALAEVQRRLLAVQSEAAELRDRLAASKAMAEVTSTRQHYLMRFTTQTLHLASDKARC